MVVDKSKWGKINIGQCCIIQNGTRIVRKDTEEGQYFVYGGGGATFTTTSYNRENAIVISRFAMSKKCTRYINEKFFLNDSGLSLIPKDETILFDYLKWNIFALNDKIYELGKGVAQKNLDMNRFPLLLLNVPTKEEQEIIAYELNAIETLIDGYNNQIKDLNEMNKSIFINMFGDPIVNNKGWKTTKLKNVTKLITNGNTPKGGEKVYVNKGIMFFRSQNVWRNELKLDDIAYIDEETNSALKSSILHHNDILITKTGRINTENSSLGRPALFTGEDNTANINGHVYLVRLTDEVNPIYYLYALLSDSFKELIRSVCVGAIDKRQLNRTHIEDFPVMLAPREMQEKFASLVGAIEKQKALLREQLADAEQLMAERMQYYFS
jgi:restriction endonuclease S subunit